MKANLLVAIATLSALGFYDRLRADEVQFVTLPDAVRTTVVRETQIPDYSRVTRVVRDTNGVYAVTVRRETGNQVVYVDQVGRVVHPQTVVATGVPAASTQVVQTVTEPAPTVETFIRSLDSSRYRLIEKKGNKEVYLDTQTGKKWSVKVEREDD
jgi:hypothetical protein